MALFRFDINLCQTLGKSAAHATLPVATPSAVWAIVAGCSSDLNISIGPVGPFHTGVAVALTTMDDLAGKRCGEAL